MSKIICEICGTIYQESAERCPICGYAHGNGTVEEILADNSLFRRGMSQESEKTEEEDEQVYSDCDEMETDEEDSEEAIYSDDPQDEYRPNVLLVILLVTVITLLLTATGFLFFRFYLPNRLVSAPATEPTLVTEPEQATETTELQIPCQSLALTSGVTELTRKGQLWLLHVTALPEDTTDPLIFYSEDQQVVEVNQYGRLTAIGEGETYVYIVCGEKEIRCRVVVRFEEETVPTEPIPGETENLLPAETVEVTVSQQITETVPPTEEAGQIVLKLKDTDRSSNKRGVSFDLQLDCDLRPEDVTWLTLDSKVAIVKNGTVTTIGPGSTKIIAQYKGQQVECIIRCNF